VEAGPKAILDTLVKDERFREMGIQKFKRIYAKVKVIMLQDKTMTLSGKSGYNAEPGPKVSCEAYGVTSSNAVASVQDREVMLTRPDLSQKFGMLLGRDLAENGGHAITSIRKGGVLEGWNEKNPSVAIHADDILLSVNGKTTFDEMMGEFGQSLSCTLKLKGGKSGIVADNSDAIKEAAEWEERKARVTAALIPGLKKIIESEFGEGAGSRITRVEKMYERIGNNIVFEEENDLGKVYAPGFMEDLQPKMPWHNLSDYPWSSELCSRFKDIRRELKNSVGEDKLWTGGAYATSNEAYGADWKIMGVLTADTWMDPARFKVTTAVVKMLSKYVTPFEAFFAKMPAKTKIAPHSDNLNYILTAHLALDLEEGDACQFKVGNEERPWKEGEMLVVDTSYMHSCVNETSRARYVFVFRFWHPGLTKEELRAVQLSHAILAKATEKK